MYRTITYRIHPTAGQRGALVRLLRSQCSLYNAALDERRGRWAWSRERVSWIDQFKELTGASAEIPSLDEFGVTVHRGTLKRLDEAFQGFFRRVSSGQTPGYPRFKASARFDSVTYPTTDAWKLYVPEGRKGTYGRLRIRGVGHVRVKLHRSFDGAMPAQMAIRRRGDRWEATVFYKNVTPRPPPTATGIACGVDRGVAVLAAVVDATGEEELVPNPRPLQRAAGKLVRKQQRLARHQCGSNRRARTRAEVATLHRRVANARRDTNHQLSRRLVDRFDLIAFEQLDVRNMVRAPKPRPDPNHPGEFLPNGSAAKAGMNRSILDAGWGQLASMVAYKAEEAGRRIVFVDPRYTSQTCAQCGHRHRDNRKNAAFCCQGCGHEAHADINAATDILCLAEPDFRPGSGHARLTA